MVKVGVIVGVGVSVGVCVMVGVIVTVDVCVGVAVAVRVGVAVAVGVGVAKRVSGAWQAESMIPSMISMAQLDGNRYLDCMTERLRRLPSCVHGIVKGRCIGFNGPFGLVYPSMEEVSVISSDAGVLWG